VTRLPPGRTGLPLLGETLGFLQDTFGFIEKRRAEHGPVFRTRLLGKDTAVLCGAETTSAFLDGEKVQRADAMPSHLKTLFGGVSVNQMDGDLHRGRKRHILAAFTREALASYLPEMQAIVARAFASWSSRDEVRWVPELKRLAVEVIATNLTGAPPSEKVDELVELYRRMTVGAGSLPIALPGTGFQRGANAVAKLLIYWQGVVAAHRKQASGDGVSRILAAGEISDEDLARELHHLIVAGLIIFAEFAGTAMQLDKHPEARERIAVEARALPPQPTPEAIDSLVYLEQAVAEVKRLTPMLPGVFGRARADLEVGGYTIPKGWTLLWALRAPHVDGSVFAEPDKFDPGRFAPARAEHRKHEHAFVPQGAGSVEAHKCAGVDYATYFMKLFALELARHRVELPAQDLAYDWSLIPPEPKSGLRARIRRA